MSSFSRSRYPICYCSDDERASDYVVDLIAWAETSSEPVLFPGLLAGWPAVSLWAGRQGLAHLRQLAGMSEVQVMLSSAPIFFGDISRHQPSPASFSLLLDLLAPAAGPELAAAVVVGDMAAHQGSSGGDSDRGACDRGLSSTCSADGSGGVSGADGSSSDSSSCDGEDDVDSTANGADGGGGGGGDGRALHVYLAQQPLTGGLAPLQADLPLPRCLYGKDIASTNLWMCGGAVRSSLHYDPHHNLLAVVSGRKSMTLIPPYMTHCVYPMTLTGDASNHSHVPFADPHPAAGHPAYLAAMRAAAAVELQAGDALFVPEGWWHQVDSGPETTIAVNYWWRSALTDILSAPPPPAPPPLPPSATAAAAPSAAPTNSDGAAVASGDAFPQPRPSAAVTAVAPPASAAAVGAAALVAAAPPLPHPPHPPAPHAAAKSFPQPGTSTTPLPPRPPAAEAKGGGGGEGAGGSAATGGGGAAGGEGGTGGGLPPDEALPGPGLRNLFALRQVARAAVDDIAEGLLAAVATVPASSATSAASALLDAVRQCAAEPATTAATAASLTRASPAAADTAATTVSAPKPLPPYVLGLLLRLRPGESASLGLSGCPVASVLAALTPLQLAEALYGMCDAAPAAVSELLTTCCRVPAVACLLTRAFDRLGSSTEPYGGAVGGTAGCAGAAAGAAATDERAPNCSGVLNAPKERQPAQRPAHFGVGIGGGIVDGIGIDDTDDGTDSGGGGGGGGDGSCPGQNPGRAPKRLRLDKGELHGAVPPGRQRCTDDGCTGGSGAAGSGVGGGGGSEPVGRESIGGCKVGSANGGSGGSGGGGSNGAAATAAVTLPPDFFQRLYGTVADPDEVFRRLLAGRAELNVVARRILMDSVLS